MKFRWQRRSTGSSATHEDLASSKFTNEFVESSSAISVLSMKVTEPGDQNYLCHVTLNATSLLFEKNASQMITVFGECVSMCVCIVSV